MKSKFKNIKVILISVLACLLWVGCPSIVCKSGEQKDAGDGCNTCVCDRGTWACTEMACNLDEPVLDAGSFLIPAKDAGQEIDKPTDAGVFTSPVVDSGLNEATEIDAGVIPNADGGVALLPNCAPINFTNGAPNYVCPLNADQVPQSLRDVAYGTDALQKIDLYIPEVDTPLPLLIWIHGGAWRMGDKKNFPCYIWEFTQGEYVIASVNYRLTRDTQDDNGNVISNGVPWPAQIADVKQAVRFLRANASTYMIHPEQIGVIGSSAGGHLSAVMNVSADDTWLRGDALAHLDQSDAVGAAVDMFGPVRPDLMDQHLQAMGICQNPQCHSCVGSAEYDLLDCNGTAFESCNVEMTKMSPMTYVDANDPPIIVAHGDQDCSVPPQQSQLFVNRLTQHGVEHEHIVVPGATHDKFAVGAGIGNGRFQRFFDKHLRGCQRP